MKAAIAILGAAIVALPATSLGDSARGRADPSATRVAQARTLEDEMTLHFDETLQFWRKGAASIGWKLTAWLPSGCHRLVAPPGLVVDDSGRLVVPIRLVVDPGPCTQAFTERTVEGELPVRSDGGTRFVLVATAEDERRLFVFEGRW